MTTTRLARRSFLRGLGGFAVALPMLEAMGSRAWADPVIPTRFAVSFAGTSLGADGHDLSLVVPSSTGAGYTSTRGLLALADPAFGVKGDVSVVTGLDIPVAPSDADPIPSAGASPHYHGQSRIPQLTGMRTGPQYTGFGDAPTCDQLVADDIAGATVQRVLAYRVQAASYVNGSGSSNSSTGTSSYRKDSAGHLQSVPAVYSPHQAFATLFGGFVAPGQSAEATKAALLLARRRSVVDLVRDDTQALMGKLGRADQQRMQRHLEEIRGMENRLAALTPPAGSACHAPPDPGADPAIAGAGYNYVSGGTSTLNDLTQTGYSNEDLRADLLADFITMAFACDLSRVANFWLTYHQSFMSMYPINGTKNHMHGMTHGGDQGGIADAVNWHVKQFARLVKKLKDTKEVDQSSLLDHTALALTFEGGGGAPMTDVGAVRTTGMSSHCLDNMMVLVAGRAGGLKPGKHIAGNHRNPGSAVFSAMKAAGYSRSAFGEVTTGIPELFT